MSDILFEGGTYQYDRNNPYEITFSGATDIILPFQGTIVVPNNTTEALFSGLHRMMFISLLYPTKIEGMTKTFPFLRDFNNRPMSVSGPCLFLVAEDTTFLDDIDLGQLFEDPTELHSPAFRANTLLSSTARYFIVKFDPAITLPENLLPFSRKKNFKLAGHSETGDDPLNLKNALNAGGGNFSGKIFAFDIGGHQTEAYSSLKALGVETISGAPGDTQIRVQFVDSHGTPLTDSEFPLNMLDTDPSLGKPANFNDCKFFTYSTSENENLKLEMKNNSTSDYKDRFHYASFWPGYSTPFKLVKESGLTIKPFENIPADGPKPTFMRLALFHPSDEFQDEVGGNIKVDSFVYYGGTAGEQAVFKDNGFRLFTTRNVITPMNSGEIFFSDYHKVVSKLKEGDKLYQASWIANAHLHLKGSMATRLISPSGDDPGQVYDVLEKIRDNVMYVPLDDEQDGQQNYIVMPQQESFLEQITSTFGFDIETNPVGDELPKQTHKGFVRANTLFGWKMQGNPALIDHTIYAYWKNDMKLVRETVLNFDVSEILTLQEKNSPRSFREDIIELDIDESDPPKATIRRIATIEVIREWLRVPTQDPFNYQLLVINLSSGYTHLVPLNPEATNPDSSDLVLVNMGENKDEGIPGMTGDDSLAIAVLRDRPPGELNYRSDLLTNFKTFEYSDHAHTQGMVPRLTTEYGGLLRSAIAKGVEVRALKWDHILNKLAPSDAPVLKGHNNNQQIVATINRAVIDNNQVARRGYAFIDQSTRELGAWHQKPTAIMKKVPGVSGLPGDERTQGIAYLGGLDLALDRWDGDYFYERDPDRQGEKKYDVQLKIDGEAAWDVLRNFHHRWKGISQFFKRTDEICQPLNSSEQLLAEVNSRFVVTDVEEEPVKFPKNEAFVQINRTIPPFSCYANDNVAPIADIVVDKEKGELGSHASYLKGISNAKKFILINEQYFFSPEVATAVRDALVRSDGPQFAIIVLPMKLSENKHIDPLFFKLREKMFNVIRYGYNTQESDNPCGRTIALNNENTTNNISDRIAIMTPMNHQGVNVYCHSKHILIDDVWMTIGSANMSNRGLTYEGEINAASMGQKLYKGGTHVIREQRIELCRRLLGLPKAYRSALHDPFAMFRLLKQIEKQGDSVSLNVYPLKPMVKRLDTTFVAEHFPGDEAYNHLINFVTDVDVNDPSFNYWICYLIDADGRDQQVDRLGYLGRMLGITKHLSFATGKMSILFDDPGSRAALINIIQTSQKVLIKIYTTLYLEDVDGDTTTEGPFLQESYPLEVVDGVIQLKGLAGNLLSVIISTSAEIKVEAKLFSEFKGVTQEIDYGAEHVFIPDDIGINIGDETPGALDIMGTGEGGGGRGEIKDGSTDGEDSFTPRTK